MFSQQFPTPGDVMTFSGVYPDKQVREEALKVFSIGSLYTVKKVDVYNWAHFVHFEEVPGKWNGVLFTRQRQS